MPEKHFKGLLNELFGKIIYLDKFLEEIKKEKGINCVIKPCYKWLIFILWRMIIDKLVNCEFLKFSSSDK